MNSLLMKHRPSDITPDEWAKLWDNSSYTLEPLAKVLKELKSTVEDVKPDDFDCPNHYAKLAYEAGQKAILNKVLGLLPEKAKL